MMYLIHTGLLLGGCFLYYWVLLRNETHFSLNRWILLACLAGSLLLPLITVPAGWSLREALTDNTAVVTTSPEKATKTIATEQTLTVNTVPLPEIGEKQQVPTLPGNPGLETSGAVASVAPQPQATATTTSVTPPPAPINWFRLLWWFYLAGVAVFGLHFLVQLGYLVIKVMRHPGFDAGGFHLVELEEDAAPYSFWNRVFLNPNRYDPETYHQIVQHEAVHVRQRHSVDLMIAELLIIFQWFNPFAWLYRKAIENNLEFLTDAEVLRQGENPVDYQLSLVKVAAPNYPLGLTTSYNQSLLEKRIAMMKTKKSSLASGWKYLSILPLLLLSMLQFNAVAQAPVVPVAPTVSPAAIATPEPVVAPTASPAPTAVIAPATSPAELATSWSTPEVTPMPMPMPMTVSPDINISEVTATAMEAAEPHLSLTNTDFSIARRSWTAEIEGDEICFTFIVADDNRRHLSTSDRCFPRSNFGTLPTGTMGEFSLKRESGTILFNGVFDGNEGVGNFTFTPAPSFEKMLAAEGFEYEDLELLHFFFIDFTQSYLTYLKRDGFNPTERQLFKLAIFGFSEQNFKKTLAEFNTAGYKSPLLKEMIELRIHGVDGGYINELAGAGYENLSLDDIKKARIHGLSAEFVNDMAKAGFPNLQFEDVIKMSIHGIDSDYVKELADLGYSGLPADEVVRAKIHGVSTQGLADLKKAGFTNLTLKEAREARIHGVDAEYVRELADLGYNELDLDEIVKAKIHGVSERKIGDLRKAGLTNLTLKQARDAAIHGVNAEYVRELADLGYEPLDIEEVIKARIHGVSERKIGDLKAAGLTNLTLKEARDASIHGVNAEEVKELRDLGYTDLDFDDFVKARIHGISSRFVRSYADVGFGKISFKDLVKLKIHNVSPDFIKKYKRDGDDIEDLISDKVRGRYRD
ncbi:M56 family metallopeptidase [Neolewinella persica]|uniref:M56 family metallopeptidase n=1 Tax=Neolewinella persica TaxID=70998 RepID=UPI000382001A|nr:M56 family metallopeptidase [Neolewinella persica]